MKRDKTKFAQLLLDRGMRPIDVVRESEKRHKVPLRPDLITKVKNNGAHNVSFAILIKLCQVLQCTPNDILDYERFMRNHQPSNNQNQNT